MARVGAPSLDGHACLSLGDAIADTYAIVVTRDGEASVGSMLIGSDSSGAVEVAIPISRAQEILSVTIVGVRNLPGLPENATSSFTIDMRDPIGPSRRVTTNSCLDQSDSHHEFKIARYRSICIDCVQTCIGEFCGEWYEC